MPLVEKYLIQCPTQKFTKSTFSGYKKVEVITVLKKTILKGELDRACYWGVELDMSKDTTKLWDRLISFSAKEINIANPNLPIFLWKRLQEFKSLEHKITPSLLLNNQESRNKLCELIAVLTLSPKKKIIPLPQIKEIHFELYTMQNYMVASDLSKLPQFWKEGDPPEIKIPLNEIANFLSMHNSGSSIAEKTLFWLSWLLTWGKLHKKKFGDFTCSHRKTSNINSKYTNDSIWIVWNIILAELVKREDQEYYLSLKENIECLYKLYKFEYTRSKKSSRIYLVIFAILLILDTTPTIDFDNPIFYKDNLRIKAMVNINNLYYTINLNKSRPIFTPQELRKKAIQASPYFSNLPRENIRGFTDYMHKKTQRRPLSPPRAKTPPRKRTVRPRATVQTPLVKQPRQRFAWKLFKPSLREITPIPKQPIPENLYTYYQKLKQTSEK